MCLQTLKEYKTWAFLARFRAVALILLLLALVLSACARPTPPPTPTQTLAPTTALPTATSTAEVSPAATPEPTNTPTATTLPPTPTLPPPTPTNTVTVTVAVEAVSATPAGFVQSSGISPAAAAALDEAERYLFNGNYAAAASSFQTLASGTADGTVAALATFGLGRAQWMDGEAAAAATTFTGLSQNGAFVAAHPEVLYWLGRALGAQGEANAAAAAFASYAERRPVLAGQAYEAAGRVLDGAFLSTQAIASYEKALANASNQVAALRARELVAAAHSQAGDYGVAGAQYQAILAEARNPDYRAEILYLLGATQMAVGQPTAAWESWQQALRTQPDGTYGYLSAVELVNAQQPVDELLRARADLAANEYQLALDAVNRFRTATPGHDGEAHALAARIYEAQGAWDSAAVEWSKIIDTLPNDPRIGDAWLGRARSQWREGDTISAHATYLRAAESVANRETAATALWWAGWLAEREDNGLIDAVGIYRRLMQSYPESTYAPQAGFRAGLAAYRADDTAQARELWTNLAGSGGSLWNAAADFWLGKLLQAEGQADVALEHWRGVAERWTQDNYYGLRAAENVAASTGEVFPVPAPAGAGDELVELASWLQSWAGAVTPGTPGPLTALGSSANLTASLPVTMTTSATSGDSADFVRAAEWKRIGDGVSARAVLESLRSQWEDDAIALTRLALFARDLGYYDVSIRAAARVMTLSGKRLAETPMSLQRLIYPLYFGDLILPAAAKYKLDPHAFLALVRQESLFGSIATSGAAARGLTQVIPSTGRGIAEQLRWPNYSDELLYRPYVSVEFGTYYLGRSLEASGGNLPQALAGYNGGPGNAGVWRRIAGNDDDLFVEVVSFTETQSYLRGIAVQDNHFHRIYPDLTTVNP